MISAVKATTLDIRHQEDYVEPTINIEELPDIDPWSTEGVALAQFEKFKDAAQIAADQERTLLHEISTIKKQIRAYALEHRDSEVEHSTPEELSNQLAKKMDELTQAQLERQASSTAAQDARMRFSELSIVN
jgi:BCCT family betaine/carnitine transporter